MAIEIENILDTCIERLQAGETKETVLADYPEIRDMLQPMLTLAFELTALEVPQSSPEAIRTGEQRMLNQITLENSGGQAAGPAPYEILVKLKHQIERKLNQFKTQLIKENSMFRKPVVVIAIILALIVGGGAVTAAAAQTALPGDFMYPVKTTLENVRIQTAFDTSDEARLSIQFTGNRLEEISRLVASERDDDVVLGLEEFEKYLRLALESLNTVAKNDPERASELANQLSELLAEQSQIFATLGNGSADNIQEALREAQILLDASAEPLDARAVFQGFVNLRRAVAQAVKPTPDVPVILDHAPIDVVVAGHDEHGVRADGDGPGHLPQPRPDLRILTRRARVAAEGQVTRHEDDVGPGRLAVVPVRHMALELSHHRPLIPAM